MHAVSHPPTVCIIYAVMNKITSAFKGLSVCVGWCCTVAYDFILVIVVTSLFVIHTFSHTLTLLSGLYQMLLDSAAVYIMLCCCVQRDLCWFWTVVTDALASKWDSGVACGLSKYWVSPRIVSRGAGCCQTGDLQAQAGTDDWPADDHWP